MYILKDGILGSIKKAGTLGLILNIELWVQSYRWDFGLDIKIKEFDI